jgi:hypothetical protein
MQPERAEPLHKHKQCICFYLLPQQPQQDKVNEARLLKQHESNISKNLKLYEILYFEPACNPAANIQSERKLR